MAAIVSITNSCLDAARLGLCPFAVLAENVDAFRYRDDTGDDPQRIGDDLDGHTWLVRGRRLAQLRSMHQVNLEDLHDRLAELMAAVEAGETILVCRDQRVVGEIKPMTAPVRNGEEELPVFVATASSSGARVPDLHPGAIWTSDDFMRHYLTNFGSGANELAAGYA